MIEYSFALIVALGIATVLVIRHVARGTALRIGNLGELEGKTTPIDLVAFRNLMDGEQELFLRNCLPTRDHHRLQRMKIDVAVSYVKAVYANAAILIRVGEALQLDPATKADGYRILDLALKNRVSAALLLVKLRIGWLYPDFVLSTEGLHRDYSKLREDLGSILHRTMPLKSSHIVAAL